MKRVLILITLILLVTTGCALNGKSAAKFKNEYESLNGTTNAAGKEHRTVSIDKKNPFEYISPADLVKKLEKKESFYVYFGDKMCPWCRSVIETAIKEAKTNKIKKIYYVPIWDDEGNEVLRDKWAINDENKLEAVIEGTDDYKKLLELLDNVLPDYVLVDQKSKNVFVGEKRIFAPSFIRVTDGIAQELVEGISSSQNDSREELTSEMLKEQKEIFDNFFTQK